MTRGLCLSALFVCGIVYPIFGHTVMSTAQCKARLVQNVKLGQKCIDYSGSSDIVPFDESVGANVADANTVGTMDFCNTANQLGSVRNGMPMNRAVHETCRAACQTALKDTESIDAACFSQFKMNRNSYLEGYASAVAGCSNETIDSLFQQNSVGNATASFKEFCGKADGGPFGVGNKLKGAGDKVKELGGKVPDWLKTGAAIGAGVLAASSLFGDDDEEEEDKDKNPASSDSNSNDNSSSGTDIPPAPGPDPVTPENTGDNNNDDDDDDDEDSDNEKVATTNPIPGATELDYESDGGGDGGDDAEGTTVPTEFDANYCAENESDPLCQVEDLASVSRRDQEGGESAGNVDVEDAGGSSSSSDSTSGTGDGSTTSAFEGGQTGGGSDLSGGGEAEEDFGGERELVGGSGNTNSTTNLFLSNSVRGGAPPEGAGTERNAVENSDAQNEKAAAAEEKGASRGLAQSAKDAPKDGVISPNDSRHPCNVNPNGRECLQLQNQAINKNIIERYKKMGIYIDNPIEH